jgi:hypothetical protein
MKRGILALAIGLTLAMAGGAQGKAPPDGISFCGQGGCLKIASNEAEQIFTSSVLTGRSASPAAPAPFYLLRWSGGTDGELSAYYVPTGARMRVVSVEHVSGSRFVSWRAVSAQTASILRASAQRLAPFAVPSPTEVRVGMRVVAEPQSYLRLFNAGKPAFTWVGARGWLRVSVRAGEPSPWTDGLNDIRISRRKGFVWVDGTVRKVSTIFAARARRALSLSP